MSILTFKGGVHPYDGKELTMNNQVIEYNPKEEIAIALSQHIGAPATPIVKIGDEVKVGQKIAEASGFISANIHSSVSGKVKKIESRLMANGTKSSCIIIENDQEYNEIEYTTPKPLSELSKSEIREMIKEAGVVGMGGACFPTNVKLTPKNEDEIDYVIVNGAECEPYLTSDYRRMIEEPEILIEGLRVSLTLFENAKGIIAVEDNKPEAIKKLKELVKNEPRMEVKQMYTKYPQGAERMLIYACTGRKINSSMLPADAGCVVDNVDTMFAIYNAVICGKPLIQRIMTITGDAIKNPSNFLVRIGTNQSELIEAAGGFVEEPEKIISGGPMMGFATSTTEVPVQKGSSALLCFIKDQVSHVEESNCINCGRCVNACPENLLPSRLAQIARHGDMETFEKMYGLECCECGSCSYVCPAKRNLAQSIKTMRKEVLASKRK